MTDTQIPIVKSIDEIDDVMLENRKKMIVVLNLMLKEFEIHPEKLRGSNINEINRIYKSIKSADDAIERTKVMKGKLGLDAVKTFILPYQRMSLQEILRLKANLNASFERVIKLKSGEQSGQDTPDSG